MEDATLTIMRRDDGYFILATVLGEAKKLGPYPSESDARLIFDYLMDVAKRGGAIDVSDLRNSAPSR